jgi:hypothetical protein
MIKINRNKLKRRNRDRIKGDLFEVVLEKLLLKSGFSPNFQSDQFTKNLFKIKGRGATYKPDLVGVFQLGIPFVNPLLLIGEAKYYKGPIGLSKVREFLGSFIDFSQFPSINLGASGDLRYEALLGTRFNYCPIYFSIHGFKQSAAGLMFTHGINYISYENSEIMMKFEKLIENILNEIKLANIETRHFKIFRNIDSLEEIPRELVNTNFYEELNRLSAYLNGVNSIIGVLDLRFPVHILYEKKVTASTIREVYIAPSRSGSFILVNDGHRKFGEFTFVDQFFISKYVKYAQKKGFIDKIFRQVDIVVKDKTSLGKDIWNLKQLIVKEASRGNLINTYGSIIDKENEVKEVKKDE